MRERKSRIARSTEIASQTRTTLDAGHAPPYEVQYITMLKKDVAVPTEAAASQSPIASPQSAMKLVLSPESKSTYVQGRRAFFKYRDLGATEASNGLMRGHLVSATGGLTEPTGWHYHLCQAQFYYILEGWFELELEDGTLHRIEAGDAGFIPGGVRHNELRISDVFKAIEVTIPADMGTVPCDPPEGLPSRR